VRYNRVSHGSQVTPEHVYPEEWKEKLRKEYPEIQPMVIKGKPLAEVFFAVAKVVNDDMPRLQLTHQEDREGRIEGIYTSLFMRKKEDFTILVAEGSADDEVTVNMRTRGQAAGAMDGDQRIMAFFKALQAELVE